MKNENPKEKPESIPFEGLTQSQYDSNRIYELEKSPHLLVRRWELAKFNIGETEELKSGETIRQKAIENFKRGVKMFHMLHERFGIAIPRIDLVIGRKYKGDTGTMFTLTDRIYGKNLVDTNVLPNEAFEKTEQFFAGMTQHYRDTLLHGGDYWNDFSNGQIVFGHKKGEKENNIYIVDIEPRFDTHHKGGVVSDTFMRQWFELIFDMEKIEKKFSPPKKFIRVRALMKEMLPLLPKNTDTLAAKKILENE